VRRRKLAHEDLSGPATHETVKPLLIFRSRHQPCQFKNTEVVKEQARFVQLLFGGAQPPGKTKKVPPSGTFGASFSFIPKTFHYIGNPATQVIILNFKLLRQASNLDVRLLQDNLIRSRSQIKKMFARSPVFEIRRIYNRLDRRSINTRISSQETYDAAVRRGAQRNDETQTRDSASSKRIWQSRQRNIERSCSRRLVGPLILHNWVLM